MLEQGILLPGVVACSLGYVLVSRFFLARPHLLHPLHKRAPNTVRPGLNLLFGAHRGGACERPENTLHAFDHALANGAQLLELDVYLTRDRLPVVIHDAHLQRLCGVNDYVENFMYKNMPPLLKNNTLQLPQPFHAVGDFLAWPSSSLSSVSSTSSSSPLSSSSHSSSAAGLSPAHDILHQTGLSPSHHHHIASQQHAEADHADAYRIPLLEEVFLRYPGVFINIGNETNQTHDELSYLPPFLLLFFVLIFLVSSLSLAFSSFFSYCLVLFSSSMTSRICLYGWL